jgi:hypothetical protein
MRTVKATWCEQPVSNWPDLTPNTYYWIVLAPGRTMPLPNGTANASEPYYNGALWAGVNVSYNPVPTSARRDKSTFIGRQLTTQRFPGDTKLSADRNLALSFAQTSLNWANCVNASVRYTNWAALKSQVRYGLQVIGTLVLPSRTATPSFTSSISVTRTTTGALPQA